MSDRRPRQAALIAMAASGFAGLVHQVVWTQRCALWLGHEAAAMLAVVAAFFGGLAVGALLLGGRIEASARPRRWYVACELVIAGWSAALIFALRPLGGWLSALAGVPAAPPLQWAVAFGGTFALLLPATASMGATLPAMERLTAQLRAEGRSLASLYGANTAGAVLGVAATAFWLIPGWGLARTAGVCVALNLLGALVAQRVLPATVAPASIVPVPARAPLVRLGGTGLLGIAYEVLVVRVLSQVAEDTVYTFALLLAVYLVGSAVGAAAYQRWLASSDPEPTGARLLAAQAWACLLGTATLWASERVRAAVAPALGGGVTAALAAEALLAALAFGPPTVVMGALFCHLARRAHDAGASFGQALGVNTLGAAVAPALFGVLVVPALGAKAALLLVAGGYLLVTRPRLRVAGPPAVAALGLALLAPPLIFVAVPPGGHVVSYEEGVMAAVSVVEDADGVARLRIDDRQQEGSSNTLRVDGRQAWLPLLLHPAPRRALFLGLGTGVTAASAAEDPALEVDAVELLPEVIRASGRFTRAFGATNPRLHVVAGDARRCVLTSDRRYDVIVSDNFHPARSGSGALYTVEHFRAVRARLAEGGLFCQWLPLHQLDLESLRSIVRAFLIANPRGWAMLASNSLETPVLGLVARADGERFDAGDLRARLARPALPPSLAGLGIEDELALLGGFVGGPAALERFAGAAPANTDDRPVVAYRAPWIAYAPDSTPGDRLLALLRALSLDAGELVAGADPMWSRRLEAYWAARSRFIERGRDVRPSARVQEMLAQVREPLLSVLRLSPDFRPAYDPLLMMATALARSDAGGARALLAELARLQPARPEAAQALVALDAAPIDR